MFKQMSHFFENIFSNYQCGFWMSFSTQQCLLTDLSKVVDYLDYELLIAKQNTYRFSLTALNLVLN